jgi:cobalt-zinc-cadmium efflux system membrane fusion protein
MNQSNLTAVFLAATLLLAGCDRATPSGAADTAPAFTTDGNRIDVGPQSPLRGELRVSPVVMDTTPSHVAWPTTVEIDPARSIALVAPGSGRIVQVKVALGEKVRKNQVLLAMASGDVAQARSDQAKALDAETLAKRALDRAQQVNEAGGASTKDLEAARSAFAQAAAERARADTQVAALIGNSRESSDGPVLQMRAPIDGVVTSLSVASGALINDTSAVLMTVTDLDRVWVTANVPEAESASVSRGSVAALTFTSLPGLTLQGRVDAIDPVLDSTTRRVKVHLVVDNHEERLLPNMFGLAAFALPGNSRLIVPQTALVMDNDRLSVYVERAPWRFERRDVETGRDEGPDVEVVHGLQAGDRVVTRGGVLLQ